MTIIQFATCNRGDALRYIQRVYPGKTIADEGIVSELLDYVQQDIVRIQDPMMYGNRIAIIPATNFNENMREEITAIARRFAEWAEQEDK